MDKPDGNASGNQASRVGGAVPVGIAIRSAPHQLRGRAIAKILLETGSQITDGGKAHYTAG